MIALDIWNSSVSYTIDDVVNNITIDENLTSNLESSSSIWKVTIPQNNPYILDIIQKDELHAKLYDGTTVFYTGWVSTNFNYTVDTHGQQVIQITLEDNGTHLFKTPYTKDESKVISGKFSSITTGDLGVVQQICAKCGITYVNNIITDPTQVETVADAGETCEELLKSVCKEMKHVYLFNENGQLYLKPLSTDTLPTLNPIYDNALYDSINLVRRARTYRGSRIKWDELDTRTGALIYRVIEGQSTTHPDCYVAVTNGQTLPSADGGFTYYDATDIKNGSEVFSISNVSPSIQTSPNNIINYQTGGNTFTQYGAKSLKMLMTATASGHITKLQATADIRYVKSENVTYGDANDPGESITENLHEIDCRWIHTETPAKYFANFVAQYDRYCSSEFTFNTKGTYALGDIIRLNENLHTGLDAYLMVTRRSRTLTSYDSSNKTFGGVWTYRAVATKAFNYNKTVSKESTSAPPSTSYTEAMPDVSSVASIQLTTDKSFLIKDLRSSRTQTMHIYAYISGGLSGITVTAYYSNGTAITVTTVTADEEWTITVPENIDVNAVNITAKIGTEEYNSISVSYNDQTHYYKFLGNFASAPTESQVGVILVNDFYLNTTDGKTYECTAKSGSTLTWSEMPLTNAENANKFLTALESATRAGVQLETMSNPNTVSWFNTIIAAKAVIDSLFSRYITILNGGAIHSSAYTDAGVYQGPGAGFWLGSNGELKCETADINNANAVDINISGNSSFHGSFDCSIIKTTPEDPSTYITLSPVGADGAQCKRIVDRLLNNGLIPDWAGSAQASGMIPISVVGVSDIAFMKVTYQKGTRSGTTTYYARVNFYNSSGTELNIRDYSVLNVSKSGSGSWTNYLYSSNLNSGDLTNIPGEYAAQAGSTDGITIRVLTGQSRLWMSLPTANEATALTSGMLFRSVTPVSTGTTGVTGYAVYMKP